MQKEYKYRAFISYSHKDKAFAKWLHKRIENYKIPKSLREKYPHLPKDLKRSVFRDEEELPTSSVLGDHLKYALDNSQKLIVICSPDAVASKWVNEEIRYFKEVHGEFSVLAILKRGEPKASTSSVYDSNLEAFPKSLLYKLDKSGQLSEEETEPLAGDARSYWGREMALMKMIAGLLEVDFADLWVREKKEARKRKVFWFMLLASFIALAFYASTQFVGESTNKELERIDKEISTIEYRIKNEELLTSKVIELNEKLKKLKQDKLNVEDTNKWLGKYKTPLLEKVKIVAKEENVGTKKAIKLLTSVEAKANREKRKKDSSKELVALAKLYVQEYQFEEANESYAEAVDEFFDYENVHEYAIFLDKQHYIDESIKWNLKLLKTNLINKEKSAIYNNLGLLYKQTKEYHKAQKVFLKSLELFSSNSSFLTYKNIGDLYLDMNQSDKAKQMYKQGLDLREKLKEENSLHIIFNLASLHYATGKLDSNITQLEQALKIINKERQPLSEISSTLITFDDVKRLEMQILFDLAQLYSATNQVDKTKDYYLKILGYVELFNRRNSPENNLLLGDTFNNLALIYKDENQLMKAKNLFLNALNRYKKSHLENLNHIYNMSVIYENLGELYVTLHNQSEAESSYLNALSFRRKLVKEDNKYNFVLANLLNDIGVLYYNISEEKADVFYLEALEIYQKIRSLDETTYDFFIAATFKNLANLYYKTKYLDQGRDNYFKALNIYQQLIHTNPKALILYSETLIMGYELYQEPIETLNIAKSYLENFNDNLDVQVLLEWIDELEESKKSNKPSLQ